MVELTRDTIKAVFEQLNELIFQYHIRQNEFNLMIIEELIEEKILVINDIVFDENYDNIELYDAIMEYYENIYNVNAEYDELTKLFLLYGIPNPHLSMLLASRNKLDGNKLLYNIENIVFNHLKPHLSEYYLLALNCGNYTFLENLVEHMHLNNSENKYIRFNIIISTLRRIDIDTRMHNKNILRRFVKELWNNMSSAEQEELIQFLEENDFGCFESLIEIIN